MFHSFVGLTLQETLNLYSGFGIFEDLRLLSRTIPELRDVEEM